jgi:hypothetical protein
MLVLVGVAAFYLEDYTYKAKVAKAGQDLDMFASALTYYDTLEEKVFSGYNYLNAINTDVNFTSWYNALLASYNAANNATWNAAGGGAVAWGDFSNNTLHALVGTYLKSVPTDPWGAKYYLNTSAGYVASLAADGKMSWGGNDSEDITEVGRGKDIVKYYLGKNIFLTNVNVMDTNLDGELKAGDYIEFVFNKDIQHGAGLTSFESSDDGTSNWQVLGTAGASAIPATDLTKFYMSGAHVPLGTSGVIKPLNNGRTIRFVISGMTATGAVGTNTIPVPQILGKYFRINTTAVNGVYSKTIVDMDRYIYNPSSAARTTVSTGYSTPVPCIGRPAKTTFNPARVAKVAY